MRTSVIIPTFNEVSTIEDTLKDIPKEVVDEILVIDGHSTDGTVELVRKLGYPLFFQKEKGFGSAISEAVRRTRGDVLIFITSDYSQNPKDIPKLLEKIQEGYDVVLASRYLPGSGSDDDTFLHYFGNKAFTFLTNLIHGSNFSDCLYFFMAIRKKVLDSLQLNSPGFEYCIELPIKVHRAGFRVAQIPSFERKRAGGKAKFQGFYHGFKILKKIIKLRINDSFKKERYF